MKRLLYLLLGLGLGASVFAIMYAFSSSRTSHGEALEALPELEPPATPVVVEAVRKRDLVQKISSGGVFKARIETHIIAQVSGSVVRLNVEEGSFIREGDIILEIDAEPYRIAYLKAKDQKTRSLREYAAIALLGNQIEREGRVKEEIEATADTANVNDMDALALISENSPKKWMASNTGLTRARLDLMQAELDLENTRIKAPFDAYVTEVEVSQSSMVTQGDKLMRLVALDYLMLEVRILESELRLARVGAGVVIQPHAFPDEQFSGTIKAISPVVDAQSGTCGIQIQIHNPQHRIKPGMFAQVAVETRVFQKRLLIPRDALLIRDDRKLVFVHEGGLAKWRYVKTGLENNEFIEIKKGLKEGEELIVSGHFNLAHDARVVVVQR